MGVGRVPRHARNPTPGRPSYTLHAPDVPVGRHAGGIPRTRGLAGLVGTGLRPRLARAPAGAARPGSRLVPLVPRDGRDHLSRPRGGAAAGPPLRHLARGPGPPPR